MQSFILLNNKAATKLFLKLFLLNVLHIPPSSSADGTEETAIFTRFQNYTHTLCPYHRSRPWLAKLK